MWFDVRAHTDNVQKKSGNLQRQETLGEERELMIEPNEQN